MTPSEPTLTELSRTIGALLREQGRTLALAESCTGGLMAAAMVDIPGSSDYFDSGVVSYSNQAKLELLGVDGRIIEEHGAVSRECATAMAEGIREARKVDISLSVTGIAGPGGERPGKPVGTVYIALASGRGTEVKRHHFQGCRTEVREQSARAALLMLREHLEGSWQQE